MNAATHGMEVNASAPVLYMALELSNKTWRLALSEGAKRRQVVVPAADLMKLSEAVAKAKERFGMPASARVVSCYEAGRDGFWLHRHLRGVGIENQVVDAASIEVSRRLRHVKTDRLDGERLLVKLIRHHTGERGGWSVVRVPSPEEEDARHLHRELERLKRERLAHRLRIQSLLVTQGVRLTIKSALRLRLGSLALWDGHSLPVELKAELEREAERLALAERQIGALEATRRERLQSPRTEAERRIVHLMRLGAIGPGSAWLLVMEFFAWRDFRNRREVAALAGLVGTPYNNGDSELDEVGGRVQEEPLRREREVPARGLHRRSCVQPAQNGQTRPEYRVKVCAINRSSRRARGVSVPRKKCESQAILQRPVRGLTPFIRP
jgi:transposase